LWGYLLIITSRETIAKCLWFYGEDHLYKRAATRSTKDLRWIGTRASHLVLLPNPRLQPTWPSAQCHRWRVFLQPHRIVEVSRFLFNRLGGPHSRILRIGKSPMLIAPSLRNHHRSMSRTEL
jgi:hypothetical protein